MSRFVRRLVSGDPAWSLLVRSFSTLTVSEVIASAAGFGAVLVLARRLGTESFGVVTLGLAIVTWLGIVTHAGTEQLGIRDVARRPEGLRPIVERLLGLRLALAAVIGTAYVLVVGLTVDGERRTVLAWFALLLLALSVNPRWIVLSVGKARAAAVGNVLARVTLLVGALLLVHAPGDADAVPFLHAGATLVYAAVVSWALVRVAGALRPRVDVRSWAATLREGVPLTVGSLARSSMGVADLAIVGAFLGPAAVGIYAAASRPALFGAMATWLFSVSFLASYSSTEGDASARLLRRASRASLALTTAAAAAVTVAAWKLVPLLFGSAYAEGAIVLAILIWRVPIAALTVPYSTVLVAQGRQVEAMRAGVYGAIANALLVLAAVPLFGLAGAALAHVGASLILGALTYRLAIADGAVPKLRAVLARAAA